MMSYALAIRTGLDKTLEKLAKRNKKQHELMMSKVEEIVRNPHRYKNLKKPLQHWKRVHIDGSFVLTFSIDEQTKTVTLEDFEHHDKIYKRS